MFEDEQLAALDTDERFRVAKFGPDVQTAFRKVMGLIRAARDVRDLYVVRSLHLEKLVGNRAGQHSMRLNKQFRLIVRFKTGDDGQTVVVIEIVDYH